MSIALEPPDHASSRPAGDLRCGRRREGDPVTATVATMGRIPQITLPAFLELLHAAATGPRDERGAAGEIEERISRLRHRVPQIQM